MKSNEYIRIGECVWCGKSEPDVTFCNQPHIIPHGLGGEEIGYDVCDDCNSYFGAAHKGEPNTNLVFKEVFSAIRAFSKTPTENTYKDLNSVYFNFRYSKNEIKIKSVFSVKVITKQFKRSLYEVFLQKLHTYNGDGLNSLYDDVRRFARYGQGELRVYYIYNNVILKPDNDLYFGMNDKSVEDITDFGFYHFWFMGHQFLLEIVPIRAKIMEHLYLQKCADTYIIPARGNEVVMELTDIRKIDFFMERFGRKFIDTNNKLQQ